MASSRLPRFKRVLILPPIQLTERDRQIIRLVYRHRFLRSHQIISLIGSSPQQLLRRLKLLYHHGYLERPRAQIDTYHKSGSRPIVYGLGNKGGLLLKKELGSAFRKASWGEKNRAVGRMFLEHALLVSDVMVSLELACRKQGIRLIPEHELSAKHRPLKWRVKLNRNLKLGVVPDRVFALEFEDSTGKPQRIHFFLEADRGTMPVKRRSLSQTSFFRKLLAYEATWTQNLHRTRFGFYRFRVLTVTNSASRVESLVDACSQLERGRGLFLFGDRSALESPEDLFSLPWHTGRPGECCRLLD